MMRRQWHKVAIHASWRNLSEVREQFPHADPVAVKSGAVVTVFNIAGNKYRLITRIELLGFPGIKPAEEVKVAAMLARLEILPLDEEVEAITIDLRRRTRMICAGARE